MSIKKGSWYSYVCFVTSCLYFSFDLDINVEFGFVFPDSVYLFELVMVSIYTNLSSFVLCFVNLRMGELFPYHQKWQP